MASRAASDRTLTGLLAGLVARVGGAPAIRYGGAAVSFAELDRRARRVARGLADLGVGPGDRVALWLPNGPAWLEVFFACARLGAIAVAVNTRFRSAEVGDIVGRSGAKILVLWPGFKGIDFLGILRDVEAAALDRLEALVLYGEGDEEESGPGDAAAGLLPGKAAVVYADLVARPALDEDRAAPDSGCVIFTTSGTTSAPKFVLHAQHSIVDHARAVAAAFALDAPGAVTLQALPLCGTFGLAQAMAGLAAGRPMIAMPVFDAAVAVGHVRAHRVTHMNGSDEMYDRMIEAAEAEDMAPLPFASLRRCGFANFGGDPGALVAAGDRAGLPLAGLYGMSEVQALFAARAPDAPVDDRVRAGGVPTSPRARVRARDPATGAVLPHGESGELELAGPSLMAEYFGDPRATAAAFTEDGYVRTGDLGYSEEGGGFTFLARMGDALRLGGFLVSPAEISDHIERHPAVEACQVVAVDGARGSEVVAFVTPVKGAVAGVATGVALDEDALIAHCAEGMAKFKVPRRILAIDAFPTTDSANGVKIQLAKLRDIAARRLEAGNTPTVDAAAKRAS